MTEEDNSVDSAYFPLITLYQINFILALEFINILIGPSLKKHALLICCGTIIGPVSVFTPLGI